MAQIPNKFAIYNIITKQLKHTEPSNFGAHGGQVWVGESAKCKCSLYFNVITQRMHEGFPSFLDWYFDRVLDMDM